MRDADERSLARALILSQFLAQREVSPTYPNVVVVISPTEKPPWTAPSVYPSSYVPPGGAYSYYRAPEVARSFPSASNLQMRVNIESTEPLWTLALEVNNPNPFPVPLNFTTNQQFDFILESQGTGQRIWQWSAGKTFNPSDRVTYWLEKGESGKFVAAFDPKSIALSEKAAVLLRGILNVFPTPLSAEAHVIYAEK